MAKKFLTIERTIFIIIIVVLIFGILFYTGTLDKINPLKKFEYDWTTSKVGSFENIEMTPYCYHLGDVIEGETLERGLIGESFGGQPKNFSICSDSEKFLGEAPLYMEIVELEDDSSSYAFLENLKSQIIAEKQSKTMKVIESREQIIYTGEFNEGNANKYFYFWNKDRYFFFIMGSETFKTKSLVKWIIQQYTGLEIEEISLDTTKEIFTLTCGDEICSSSIGEDCNSCIKDCACQSDTKCVTKTYGDGYECKSSSGQYCSWNEDCAEGYCVHNLCRSESTYCGDNYCDEYDSQNPENCGNCPQDCGGDYTQQCVNGVLKISNGYFCSWDSDCVSSNCVHGTCRSSSTYCGDNWCDYPETVDTCWSDCQ